jgi:hypothetical protein
MGVDGIEDGFGQLVQESGRQTGWRDAPGEERQSVTFRHEGAYRRRAQSGLVHTMIGTAANVSDVTQAQALLHGDETDAFGDAGYQGVEKRAENQELLVTWHVAMRPSKCKALPETPQGDLLERIEHAKASIRAKVETPFHVVKNLFTLRPSQDALPRVGQEHGPTLLVVWLRQPGAGASLATRRENPRYVLKTENEQNVAQKTATGQQKPACFPIKSASPAAHFGVRRIVQRFPKCLEEGWQRALGVQKILSSAE